MKLWTILIVLGLLGEDCFFLLNCFGTDIIFVQCQRINCGYVHCYVICSLLNRLSQIGLGLFSFPGGQEVEHDFPRQPPMFNIPAGIVALDLTGAQGQDLFGGLAIRQLSKLPQVQTQDQRVPAAELDRF